MIVQCKKNKVINPLPLVLPFEGNKDISNANYISSTEWYNTFDDDNSVKYGLTVGNKYVVYGVLLYDGHIRYLLSDDDNIPNYFPDYLFDVIQSEIMYDWSFHSYEIGGETCISMTHSDLESSYEELRDLISHTSEQIASFVDYKKYVELYF